MPAIVERRHLDSGSLTIYEVPPNEYTMFHVGNAIGAIGKSIMVHCAPGDTSSIVYPSMDEQVSDDLLDIQAVHDRYKQQRIKREVYPGYPFAIRMEEDEGMIELTVRQGKQLPNTEVMILPLPNPIDSQPIVNSLRPGQHATITDTQTGDISYIQVVQDKSNYSHIFAASRLQLGYQTMKLIEQDSNLLSSFIQQDTFLLDILKPGDPAFNLPIRNISHQLCTLLVRNSDNRAIAPTNN